jgi:HK97 family phage major capsid protein
VPASKRALADVAQLEGLINDELSADVAEAEETEMVSGSGSGEHLTGILNTSGIQTQAFSTDLFSLSVRASRRPARSDGSARTAS